MSKAEITQTGKGNTLPPEFASKKDTKIFEY